MQQNRHSGRGGNSRGRGKLTWLQVAARIFLAVTVLVLLWRMTQFPQHGGDSTHTQPKVDTLYVPGAGVIKVGGGKKASILEKDRPVIVHRDEVPFCAAQMARPFLVALNNNIDAPKGGEAHGSLPLHKPHAHAVHIKKEILHVIRPVADSASEMAKGDVAVAIEGTSSLYARSDEIVDGEEVEDGTGRIRAGWHCVTALKRATKQSPMCILAQKSFISVDDGPHKTSELGVTPHQLIPAEHTPISLSQSLGHVGRLMALIPAIRVEGLPAIAAVVHRPSEGHPRTSSLVSVFRSGHSQQQVFGSASDSEDSGRLRAKDPNYDPNDRYGSEISSGSGDELALRSFLSQYSADALQSIGYGNVQLFDGRGTFWIMRSTPLASSSASIASQGEGDTVLEGDSHLEEPPQKSEFKVSHKRHFYTKLRQVKRYRSLVGSAPSASAGAAEGAIGGFAPLNPSIGQKDIHTLSKGDIRTIDSEASFLEKVAALGMYFDPYLPKDVEQAASEVPGYASPVALHITSTIHITKSMGLRATIRCSTILFGKDAQLVVGEGVTLVLQGMLSNKVPSTEPQADVGLIVPVVPLSLTAVGMAHGWGGIVIKDKGHVRGEGVIISATGSSSVQRVAGTGTHIKAAPAITVSPSLDSPHRLTFPRKQTAFSSSVANTEELFLESAKGRASLVLLHSAIVNGYGPGLGIGKGSMAYIANTVVQDVAQGLECVECSLWVDGSVFTDFPFVSNDFKFADEDNDGIYVRGGISLINNTIIGNALDDGIDSACNKNDKDESHVTIENTFIFNCQHEGIAISGSQGATRFMEVSHSLVRGCQQGIENGHSPFTHYASIYKTVLHANQIGLRYGDDYPLEVMGSLQGDRLVFIDNVVPYMDHVKKEHKEAHRSHYNQHEGAGHGVGSFLWSNPLVEEVGLSSSSTQHGLGICRDCRTFHPPLKIQRAADIRDSNVSLSRPLHMMLSGFSTGVVCGARALGRPLS